MRSNTAFFPVFALLSLLPACQSIEDRAEASVTTKAEKTIGFSGMGFSFTSGVCPDFPKEVPQYAGASQVGCVSLDPGKAASSPTLKALGISDGQPIDHDTKLTMLTFATTDSPEAVIRTYERELPDYMKSSDLPDLMTVAPVKIEKHETFQNPKTGFIVVVGISPNKNAAPGKTPVVVAALVPLYAP